MLSNPRMLEIAQAGIAEAVRRGAIYVDVRLEDVDAEDIIIRDGKILVNHRARELKLDPVFQGSGDKAETLKKFLKAKSISLSEVAYLGDDLPDLQVIKMVGLGVCVANSPSILIESADWQVKSNGGEGAVRELAELILQSQNKLNSSIEKYL